METNSISAIVTDPPYGLSFMGKGWDHAVPGKEYWEECKRLLKPGGFLLAMGGTRTFHRLTCAIEDAGLEIRDCLMWLYGSGFPKSHNHFGIEGYGTCLKPAFEPIIMAMKKCDGTFKQNAEQWGQAGINIDGCRIGTAEMYVRDRRFEESRNNITECYSKGIRSALYESHAKGRWPANLLMNSEAGAMLDEQSGILKSGVPGIRRKPHQTNSMCGPLGLTGILENGIGDSGGASRFFYCAKASSHERNEGLEGIKNGHPTVKPIKLMEYLIRLVMPPKDGILLDPFAGSGTTILAAQRLGFNAIGIEKDEGYCEIARARLA